MGPMNDDEREISGWVSRKTLLLLLTPGAPDVADGPAGDFPFTFGGQMPDDLVPVRRWRWRSVGRVRVGVRHAVRHGAAVPPDEMPVQRWRWRSAGHIMASR